MKFSKIPRIRSMQIGLLRFATVDKLKADMLTGIFHFSETRARISGYRDAKGTYHVNEGNHRMVAALEIYRETGEDAFVQMLLACGIWSSRDVVLVGSSVVDPKNWTVE